MISARRMLCLKTAQSRRRGEPSVRARTTHAGTFVHEEIKVRRGEHGARSPSRRLRLASQRRGASGSPFGRREKARSRNRGAQYACEAGQHQRKPHHRPRVSRAVSRVIERESRSSASHSTISRQAKRAASCCTAARCFAAARKAVRTKSAAGRSAASRGAVQTRAPQGIGW